MKKVIVMTLLSIAVASVLWSQVHTSAPVAWEHGWKTRHIVATRYKNSLIGYNIGFEFPLNPDDCDRDEIVQFIEHRGGSIYEMGGYPGASVMAIFEGVGDKESADQKLRAILPDFEKVVAKF